MFWFFRRKKKELEEDSSVTDTPVSSEVPAFPLPAQNTDVISPKSSSSATAHNVGQVRIRSSIGNATSSSRTTNNVGHTLTTDRGTASRTGGARVGSSVSSINSKVRGLNSGGTASRQVNVSSVHRTGPSHTLGTISYGNKDAVTHSKSLSSSLRHTNKSGNTSLPRSTIGLTPENKENRTLSTSRNTTFKPVNNKTPALSPTGKYQTSSSQSKSVPAVGTTGSSLHVGRTSQEATAKTIKGSGAHEHRDAPTIQKRKVAYVPSTYTPRETLRDADRSLSNEARSDHQGISDMQYHRFSDFIQEVSGIVLGENKQYLVNSRLFTLLGRFKINSVDEIVNKAMEEGKYPAITDAVIDAMTTNETMWFRDTYPYLALKNMLLPDLARRRRNPVRIWSAACSSGQEPYSIAMVVMEQAGVMLHVDPSTTQVVATDLSPEMLEHCRQGIYDAHALARGLSAERKAKFFKKTSEPGKMQIDARVRKMVVFKQLNLLGSYALLGRFDIIFCRNVLIYFNNDVKSQIVNKFAQVLNPGGYLFLGSSESLSGLTDKFDMVRCNPGLAYRLKNDL